MNDPKLAARKLSDLVDLARDAASPYEEAAVFAAAVSLYREFEASADTLDGYILEKAHEARWHICAAVGYDITNDHDKEQHIIWAHGAANGVLRNVEKLGS